MGWDLGGDAGAHEAGSWALKRSEVGLREGRWLVLKRHTLCARMCRGEGVGVRGFGDGLARWMRPGGWWECCVFFYTEGWGGVSLSLLPGEPGLPAGMCWAGGAHPTLWASGSIYIGSSGFHSRGIWLLHPSRTAVPAGARAQK